MFSRCFSLVLPVLTAWHSHGGHVVDDDGLPRPSARAGGTSPTKLHRLLVRPEGGAMSVAGPTLPSAASAGHGSYLGISCRHCRQRTTAEDDPYPSFATAPHT